MEVVPEIDVPIARVPTRCKSARASYRRRRPEEAEEEDDDGGMQKLWATDKETFYLYGARVREMLELRIRKGWSEE